MTQNTEPVDRLRPLLFSIAYRMLASASEAEDVVQEAFLRYQAALADGVAVESTKAYLSAVVTRLAIDELKSARRRRETYSGQWLPEPIVTDELEPASRVEQAESLSMAFLLLLDRLTPVERAVFLLHDVFAYEFAEIADMVGKTEANCRQIAVRARRRVHAERPRLNLPASAARGTSSEVAGEIATRFLAALRAGDLDKLLRMLAPDVVVYGDGGGKAPQWSVPIAGVERVSQLLAGVGRQMAQFGLTFEQHQVNAGPGAIVRDREGRIVFVLVLDVHDGRVHTVRSIINPDKLRHLGPVADARRLVPRAPIG